MRKDGVATEYAETYWHLSPPPKDIREVGIHREVASGQGWEAAKEQSWGGLVRRTIAAREGVSRFCRGGNEAKSSLWALTLN